MYERNCSFFFWPVVIGGLLLLGVFLRAGTLDHFWAPAANVVLTILFFGALIYSIRTRDWFWAIAYLVYCVYGVIAVVNFLINPAGATNYLFNPPTAQTSTATQEAAAPGAPAATPSPAPEAAANAEESFPLEMPPTLLALYTDTDRALNSWAERWIPENIVHRPPAGEHASDSAVGWSVVLGCALIIQLWLTFFALLRTEEARVTLRLLAIGLAVVLPFTVFGNWLYDAIHFLLGIAPFGWNSIGQLLVVAAAVALVFIGDGIFRQVSISGVPLLFKWLIILLVIGLTAIVGMGSVAGYALGAFVFHDSQILTAFVLPTVVVGFLALLFLLPNALRRRALPKPITDLYPKV